MSIFLRKRILFLNSSTSLHLAYHLGTSAWHIWQLLCKYLLSTRKVIASVLESISEFWQRIPLLIWLMQCYQWFCHETKCKICNNVIFSVCHFLCLRQNWYSSKWLSKSHFSSQYRWRELNSTCSGCSYWFSGSKIILWTENLQADLA